MNVNKNLNSLTNPGVTKDAHICGQCSSIFLSIKTFLSHKKKGCKHNRLSKVTNPTAEIKASDKVSTVDGSCISAVPDVDEKKKYQCEYEGCNYASKYPKDLQRHLRIHTGERPFQCEECGKSFSRLDKFKLHTRCHSGLKPYRCSECDYAATDASSLKKHKRIHTDERPFKCQICMYASRNSSQLVVHLRTHTGDTPFHCPHCPSKFKINSDLKRHVRLHTGDKPYKCPQCDYKCAVNGNLKTHIRLNHSKESVHKCEECEFSSPSKKILTQHEKCHCPAPIQCPHQQCPYRCQSEASLRNHMRSHSKERPFKCQHCSYTSRQPGNVRSHNKKHHSEKLAQCTRSSTIENEKSNISKTSKGDDVLKTTCSRLYKCTLCSSSFVREDSLRSHLRQHQRLQLSNTNNPEKIENMTGETSVILSEIVPPDSVVSMSDNSMFSLYPTVTVDTSTVPEPPSQQVIYHLQPGVNVLSLASNTVQYLLQASESCIMLDTTDVNPELCCTESNLVVTETPLVNVCESLVAVNPNCSINNCGVSGKN